LIPIFLIRDERRPRILFQKRGAKKSLPPQRRRKEPGVLEGRLRRGGVSFSICRNGDKPTRASPTSGKKRRKKVTSTWPGRKEEKRGSGLEQASGKKKPCSSGEKGKLSVFSWNKGGCVPFRKDRRGKKPRLSEESRKRGNWKWRGGLPLS